MSSPHQVTSREAVVGLCTVGQTVLILDEGSSARQVLGDDEAPIRAVVVGIVDQWTAAGGIDRPLPPSEPPS